jgi:hypothetical protein
VSCEKTDAGKPTVDYVIKASGIAVPANVKAVRGSVEGYGTVAEAPVGNGGFELALPATLPDKALSSVAENNRTKGVTASDPEARLAFLSLEFDGSFVSISLDDSHQKNGVAFGSRKALFIYADRPVTLSGESVREQVAKSPLPGESDESDEHAEHRVRYTDKWVEITLAAGWNRVCEENSVVLGAELYEVNNTISHKNLDDCKWNLLNPTPTPTPTPEPDEKPVS